jgi:peptidoglycan/LPS O-acetylase OafA/YrhL
MAFLHGLVFDILTGRASYQLYYILLTIQFYLILPIFLFFIVKVARHPWIVLTISFLAQVALFAFSYTQLQEGTLAAGGFWKVFRDNQDSMFFFYIFYFVAGGLAALYYQQVNAFVVRHGRLVICAFVLGLALLWFHFIYQVRVERLSSGYALSVLQPILVPYSFVVTVFLFWLASVWALRLRADGKPKGYGFWHTLSDASFGIYLSHPMLLTITLTWILPDLSGPIALRVFLVWCITTAGSVALSLLLVRIPVLSYLVGRGWGLPWPRKAEAVARTSSTSTGHLPEIKRIALWPLPAMALIAHKMDLPGLTAVSQADSEDKLSS